MAVAIPEGFGEYALLFACAYTGLQIGRNVFVVVVTPRGLFNQNFRQILAWSVLSAPLWVAGGIVDIGGVCAGFCGWVPSDLTSRRRW